MNVLFITHADNFYGSSKSLLSLLLGLQSYDLNPYVVVSAESGFTKALAENKIPFLISPVVWWVAKKPISIKQRFQVFSQLQKSVNILQEAIESWNIDLVYTNSSVTPTGRLLAIQENLPHIWHIREFGDIDFSLFHIFPKYLSKMFLKSSDAIICNSNAVKDHYFKHKTKKIRVIYNGSATVEQFDERYKKRVSENLYDDFTFAMVSLVSPKKGQEQAIKAIAALKERGVYARLVLAGHGKKEYLAYCNDLVQALGITDRVEFTGFLEDPFSIYYSTNCILVCSAHEALSRVALEAMSVGVPVIGKNSGGMPEIIIDNKTGILYDTFDQLVDAMRRVVEDRTFVEKLGKQGWQAAKEKFNIENYSNNVFSVIETVTKEKNKIWVQKKKHD